MALTMCLINIPNPSDVNVNDVRQRSKRSVDLTDLKGVIKSVIFTFHLYIYIDTAFSEKLIKYQPLHADSSEPVYVFTLVILMYDSLGHVHKLTISGLLGLAGLPKKILTAREEVVFHLKHWNPLLLM